MNDHSRASVSEDFLIILHSIFTFLDSQNFKKTLVALKQECSELGLKNIEATNLSLNKFNASKQNSKSAVVFSESQIVETVKETDKSYEEENDGRAVIKVFPVPNEEIEENEDNVTSEYSESEGRSPRQFDALSQSDMDRTTIIKISRCSTMEYSSNSSPEQHLRAPQNSPNNITNNEVNSVKENEIQSQNSCFQVLNEDFQDDSYEILKEKFLQLKDEHRRLMEITAKLTVGFQRNLKGQTESMNSILNSCREICPELFCSKEVLQSKNSYTIRKEQYTQCITQEFIDVRRNNSAASSNFSVDTFDETGEPDAKQFEELPADIPNNFQLDFHKIKNDLRNGDKNLILALLQALRWRITRNPACIRHEVIALYERFDLLDIRNCSHRNDSSFPKPSKFLDNFYCPKKTPDILQESIARLINAIASMKIGRDYLTRQSSLMNYLLNLLLGTHTLKPKINNRTRDMIIATMQKMSLRYWQRVTMINAGLCKYMVKFLSDNYKKLSSYCLEYSTALLMNLWLHVDAREKSYTMVKDIIKLLATLLDVKYENCLPYINGALYSLLPDLHFHKIAKEAKLGQVIEYRISSAEPDMQDQLRCILKIYDDPSNWQPMCDCDLGVEIENEIDLFEPELDEGDKYFTSGLSGEQLLYNYRLLFPINGSQVCATNVIWRPVTPSYAKRTSVSISALAPYAKEENSFIVQDSCMGANYEELKEFFLNKLTEELMKNDIYFEEEAVKHNDNINDIKINTEEKDFDLNTEIYRSVYTDKETNFKNGDICNIISKKNPNYETNFEIISEHSENTDSARSFIVTDRQPSKLDIKNNTEKYEFEKKIDVENTNVSDTTFNENSNLILIHCNENYKESSDFLFDPTNSETNLVKDTQTEIFDNTFINENSIQDDNFKKISRNEKKLKKNRKNSIESEETFVIVHKNSLELAKNSIKNERKSNENTFEIIGPHMKFDFNENFHINSENILETRQAKSAEENVKKIAKERISKSSGNYEQENLKNEKIANKISRIPRTKTSENIVPKEESTKKFKNNETTQENQPKTSDKKIKNDKNDPKKTKTTLKNNLSKKSVSELQEMSLDEIKSEITPKKSKSQEKIKTTIPEIKIKREKSLPENSKDKNNNKKKEFSEVTQSFQHKPTKNQIFETKTHSDLTLPAFAKNHSYDKRNISLPNSPINPPNSSKTYPKTSRDVQDDSLNVHPINVHPNCYRQNYRSMCYCNTKGTCNYLNNSNSTGKINRYSCCCYDKLKQSFELEHNENNLRNISPNRPSHGNCNINCRYSRSFECSSLQNERDSGVGSGELDEENYNAVFESRPRILRTP